MIPIDGTVPTSANHRFPPGPVTIAPGAGWALPPVVGIAYSTIACVETLIIPIRRFVVNQMLPSGPLAIPNAPWRAPPPLTGSGYWVIACVDRLTVPTPAPIV